VGQVTPSEDLPDATVEDKAVFGRERLQVRSQGPELIHVFKQAGQPGGPLQGDGPIEGVVMGLARALEQARLRHLGAVEIPHLKGRQPLKGQGQSNQVKTLRPCSILLAHRHQPAPAEAGQGLGSITQPEQGVGHGNVRLGKQVGAA
jgi:hypothetical protein